MRRCDDDGDDVVVMIMMTTTTMTTTTMMTMMATTILLLLLMIMANDGDNGDGADGDAAERLKLPLSLNVGNPQERYESVPQPSACSNCCCRDQQG